MRPRSHFRQAVIITAGHQGDRQDQGHLGEYQGHIQAASILESDIREQLPRPFDLQTQDAERLTSSPEGSHLPPPAPLAESQAPNSPGPHPAPPPSTSTQHLHPAPPHSTSAALAALAPELLWEDILVSWSFAAVI
ncbi:hypothetical protein EYF80_066932 [Liparis tanakae]|uniref:Uncharacterized protein n=1 Tax=Liparis tanakae TaxID=230148 RepID=A0A4Z2E3K5_9TELE|nr:hypothetical protein EYF80_066932 [Liparis tanakae]